MTQRHGIFGGTFNPVHYGHLAAAEEVRERLRLDRVLFLPSFLPPHKHDEAIPSAVQRLEMVRLAVSGNPHFVVSDLEVKRGGVSYTVETVEALIAKHPGTGFVFITGLDSFLEIRTWKDWERLLALCSFAVLSRPGFRFSDLVVFPFLQDRRGDLERLDRRETQRVNVQGEGFVLSLENIPFYDISSTDIRTRVRQGRTIKYHLPEPVERYIIENKLYA